MHDIIIRNDRGVREAMNEEWGKLEGYPSYWGTAAKYRRRIIREPSLHLWSVLWDAFAPTLTHKEKPHLGYNREEDNSFTGSPLFSPIPLWEEDSSDEESEGECDHPLQEEVDPPTHTWMHLLNGRLLISEREDNGGNHDWLHSELLLRDGMTNIVLRLRHITFELHTT
jgi:hypothetical protein